MCFEVKFSLLLLALMSGGSILFAFLAIQILLSVHSNSAIAEKVLSNTFGKDDLRRVVWEAASSIALISITSSISAFFVSTVQLFFAMKMLKSSPTAIKRLASLIREVFGYTRVKSVCGHRSVFRTVIKFAFSSNFYAKFICASHSKAHFIHSDR